MRRSAIFIALTSLILSVIALFVSCKDVQAAGVSDQLSEVRTIFHEYYNNPPEEEQLLKPEPQSATVTPDIQALYEVVMAEAGNQPDEGIRMVCDVVMNRARIQDMSYRQVIAQRNQFSSYSDGGIQRWKDQITDDVIRICNEELQTGPTYTRLYYFRTGHYSQYGTPAMKVGDHYFSYL